MDTKDIEKMLVTLSEYFEAGNPESDAAARAVLAAASDYREYWRPAIENYQRSPLWTGLRGPEAEILAVRLRQAAQFISGGE